MKVTSAELSQAVHAVLRSWHSGSYEDLPWCDMLAVRQHQVEQIIPNFDLAVKEVLLEGLSSLEQQAGRDAAQILRLRFLDRLTAQEIAIRSNLSESVVFKQQRAAIQDLAAIVEQAERDARFAKATRILERLDVQEPPSLFGVDDKLAELTALLTGEGPPWIVAVVGIGGIGKTSIADAVARRLASTPIFADIAWVSARRERLTFWRGIEKDPNAQPALTFEGLLDAIVEQFGFQDLAQLPASQRQSGLQARLKARPYLVVVDNLETAADYEALIPDLQHFVNPSKFLLTGRRSLHDHAGVYSLSLDELSAVDSLALLRHEADQRGLAHVANASDQDLGRIYDVTGGNPLALKLLVGQMHTLSLSNVVDDLRQAQGRTAEELYHYIYRRSWSLLNDEARRVLAIMPLVAESGGGLKQIATLSELADEPLTAALKQLITLCLVNVGGDIEVRRYSIHRLTETFLLNEVLKWQTTS